MGTPKSQYKMVLVGNASVGKSSLAIQYVKGIFDEHQEPSIGASFMTQAASCGDVKVLFEIWDTAGQERYRSLAPMYYRGSAVAVVVFDITSEESFQAVKSWVVELREGTDALIAIAGNKADLDDKRAVSFSTAKSYADSENLLFMEVSAKTAHNVEKFFQEIAQKLPKNEDRNKVDPSFKVDNAGDANEEDCAC